MAITAAFALLDTKNHPFAIDISDLQMGNLAGTQAGTVGHTQSGLMLQTAGGLDQVGHFFDTQYLRYLARFMKVAHLPGQFTAI